MTTPALSIDALGIAQLPERAPARFALLQTARRLWRRQCRVVGLLPATDRVAATGLALQLARALRDLGITPVAVLDAHPERPALSRLIPDVASQPAGFLELSLGEGIVITTRAQPVTGQDASPLELARVVNEHRERYRLTLLDLAGFREFGQHLDAFDLVDGVLIVAHAGKTQERAVILAERELPERVNLGVLLIEP